MDPFGGDSRMLEVAFDLGVAHHDDPPPEALDDLEALRIADRFRFANELRAWIEVEGGRIVDRGTSARAILEPRRFGLAAGTSP